MNQPNFAYAATADSEAGLAPVLSIFADRPHICGALRDDAVAAGFQVREVADVGGLLEDDVHPLGDVVLLDFPHTGGAVLAALISLDMRAARCGAQLIVSTTLDALDDVFACMDQSQPQLLVDPMRAERVIALGRALARFPNSRLRELSEEDRKMLLRLTEQVDQLARQFDGLRASESGSHEAGDGARRSAFRFESGKDDDPQRLARAARPPLPDPRMIRRIIRQRQLRARFFDGELFADPAWDMLLDLTASRAEYNRVSVTSLCIASSVPPTTALRWISQMTEAGLFERVEDDTDRRRAFVALTDKAADAMARYFSELGHSSGHLI